MALYIQRKLEQHKAHFFKSWSNLHTCKITISVNQIPISVDEPGPAEDSLITWNL